jgi:formate hydrogenlyase transcriptional activator
MAKQDWYEHEFHLAASGVRAYTSILLTVRGQTLGVASFTRTEPIAFSEEELTVLQDVSRAIGVAVANAMANEEISKLRDQLAEENIALRAQLGQAPWFEGLVGDSRALRRVLEAVEQVAGTGATVLITGETGTGKELIARAIHRRSGRAHGPLVQVNCSAVPATLLASELFGHERGAFTGAIGRRKGRFEQAHGGTLFLDEVGELPQEAQILLLRVLQEREFERVGGNQTLRVDVALVAATNRDLAEDVRAGAFRSDLYYRLNVFPIPVPPLRERREDIPLLVEHFAAKYGARFGRSIARVDRRTMNLLASYDWPGNVRELENVVERAVIVSRNGTLRVERESLGSAGMTTDLDEELRTQEREIIEAALSASRGRVSGPTGAAARLGMPASTVEFRIKRLGIDKFQYRKRQP